MGNIGEIRFGCRGHIHIYRYTSGSDEERVARKLAEHTKDPSRGISLGLAGVMITSLSMDCGKDLRYLLNE